MKKNESRLFEFDNCTSMLDLFRVFAELMKASNIQLDEETIKNIDKLLWTKKKTKNFLHAKKVITDFIINNNLLEIIRKNR